MRVKVSFLGILRDKVGGPSLEVELADGATFRDLLEGLAPMVEDKLGDWAWDREARRFVPRIMVSRSKVVGGYDDGTVLTDGEEIMVFPPLAGG
jgi:molybdopterin converting factor small subunit